MPTPRISAETRQQAGGRLLASLDDNFGDMRAAQRRALADIVELDRKELWHGQGARDLPEFLAGRYGITKWKARRMIGAAHALEHLPLTEHAFLVGKLPLDKVVELTRLATPATEKKLISWAAKVTPAAIREKADAERRVSLARVKEEEACRGVTFEPWIDNSGFHIEARLPAADASVVIDAIERLAKEMPPPVPAEEGTHFTAEQIREQKRADALVALCSAQIANDQDPDRATVVVHAPIEALVEGDRPATTHRGVPLHSRTAQRLCCDARLEVVFHGDDGVVGIADPKASIPYWLRRQVLARDSHSCTFPGCGAKRFLHTHHMKWRIFEGQTVLANLITVCHAHHKLVHEEGWSVMLENGSPVWFFPSGRRFEPGPAPPVKAPAALSPARDLPNSSRPWMWHLLLDETYEVIKDEATRRFLHDAARLIDQGRLPEWRFADRARKRCKITSRAP